MDKESYYTLINSYLNLLADYLNFRESKDFNIDKDTFSFFLNFSKKHSTTALLYKAILATRSKIDKEYLSQLEQYYFANLRKVICFEKERNELYECLNKNQIDYLPLKGLVIREYYIDAITREFADNDILFANKEDVIKKFFTNKGYKVEIYKKSAHDVYLKKPFYNFEMHRALFNKHEDYPLYVSYFKDYLKNSLVKQGYEHELTKEHFYIYFTAHTYKHFQGGGCGIRTLVDYYVYLRKNPNLDFVYINKELDKLELHSFSDKISSLANKIFNKQNLNEEEKDTLLYIASSGTYGTLQHSVTKGVNKKGRFRYFMSRIFPPMSFYKMAYPFMYKTKVLIPVAWFCRLFRIIFTNPKKATTELKLISKTKKEK